MILVQFFSFVFMMPKGKSNTSQRSCALTSIWSRGLKFRGLCSLFNAVMYKNMHVPLFSAKHRHIAELQGKHPWKSSNLLVSVLKCPTNARYCPQCQITVVMRWGQGSVGSPTNQITGRAEMRKGRGSFRLVYSWQQPINALIHAINHTHSLVICDTKFLGY